MLCCVSKRAAAGTDRESRPFDESRNFAMLNIAEFSREIDARFASLQKLPEEDVPDILLPCAICDRTFRPESLDKHARICERSTNKKRKPFDSAKQRIKGTDLAEFLPKQNPRNPHVDDRPRRSSAWKKSRDEFLRAIRAAKGETVVSTPQLHRPSTLPVVAAGAPTRAHEKGTCPTCNRQFGIKAYERHVAWCKERSTRLPASPAPNVAKERLEARVKYRAPMLKNRRAVTREKYSPSSTHPPVTTLPKTSTLTRTKENSTSPTGANKVDSSVVRKTSVTRRPVQTNREAVTTHSGPLKPRAMDRSNSSGCNEYNPFLLAEQQLNDLFSDTSDQSSTDGFTTLPKSSPASQLTLNHSQAFVKYPSQPCESPINASEKRASVIAPPSAFDDLTSSDLSSDFTENSASPENLKLSPSAGPERKSPDRVLGRRLLIDKSEALGEKPLIKVTRPLANRSHSVRSVSAPKAPERNKVSNFSSAGNFPRRFTRQRENGKVDSTPNNDRSNNNYTGSNGSSLSLNSIMSSDVDAKRSNFLFDELLSSFEEDTSGNLPSLRSLLKNDSLSLSSNLQHGKLNGTISDDELSSPESYKRQEVGKINADSAYSSLNRKYSNHDRDQNDAATSNMTLSSMGGTYKMSKFCHECGSKFPELAKFCCECGIQRLTITS